MSKREIYALDFAVTHVVITLDEMFTRGEIQQESGWIGIGQTLNYTSRNRRIGDDTDKIVDIHPKSWPDTSYIACRMIASGEGWDPEEGTLVIHYSQAFTFPVTFKFHDGSPSFITTNGHGHPAYEIVQEAARLRRPDLIGKFCGL